MEKSYLYDDRVVIFFNIKDAKLVIAIDMIAALDEMDESAAENTDSVRICPVPLHEARKPYEIKVSGFLL